MRLKRIAPWLWCLFLALLAFFLKFCVPGYGFSALVCLCLIGIILFYTVTARLLKKYPKGMTYLRRFFTVCLCIGLLVVGITECLIIRASFGDPKEHCDYVIVLGAKVRQDGPSLSLWDRIWATADYMKAHPDVTAVVSGGRGTDEPISEAESMYKELVKLGIEPERIWIEDRAASTWANLNYSLDLIEENTGIRPTKIGLISSEYHLFRAGLLAKKCNVELVGIPARTSHVSQAINHFMREVAGVWHYIILGGQYD